MTRKDDLKEFICRSYMLIREYEKIRQCSSDPLQKLQADQVIQDQWNLVQGYTTEYRGLPGNVEADTFLQDILGTSTASTRPMQITVHGAYHPVLPERQAAAIRAFAAVMEIDPSLIVVNMITEGSVIFDLAVPVEGAERLAALLRSSDVRLVKLGVEKVFLERSSGQLEAWVLQQDHFERVHVLHVAFENHDTPRLREVTWTRFLRAPDTQLLDELYIPALSRAVWYDRCCAYFSSQVLAVAARGFGGFIDNLLAYGDALEKPAARLLINEQIDEQDLDALLTTGDEAPLIDHLLSKFKTPQNALEQRRLEMLAWMVASGWLEVRVGWMAKTRGVVHAKYGIVRDLDQDAVAFMGSDNETGHALVENYEELEVRPSWQDPEFVSNYQERFDALWQDRDEYVRVYPLPDAVRAKIISFAPPLPPPEIRQNTAELVTAMLWHYIAAAAYLPNGEHACDATAMVDLWPHQRRVVDDTSQSFPAGRLLCDEVGMGKTIEAIQVLRRLLSGRGVQRALLLVPAGLLRQWQEELREKGGLLVPRWESGYLHQPDGAKTKTEAAEAMAANDVLLVSREWARLSSNRDIVLSAPVWDLVLLDEAHAARRSAQQEREFNSANLLLQLLRELQLRGRARGILLLSATPMQTQPWEPWDLLGVLGIGGRWMVEFDDVRQFYQGIQDLRSGLLTLPKAAAVARLVEHDPAFPPVPNGHVPDTVPLQQRLAFGFDTSSQVYADWLRQGAPLGRRMHRNTRDTLRRYYERGLLTTAPPRRQVRDQVFDYQDQAERDCYDAIETYIDERFDQLEAEKGGKGFVMTVYRRRAASSPFALRCSLGRRLEKLERVVRRQGWDVWLTLEDEQIDPQDLSDAGIEEPALDPALPSDPQAAEAEKQQIISLLERLEALGPTDSKLDEFWPVLSEITADGRSALVFTEYADTLTYLRDKLQPTYGQTLGCYSGEGGQVLNGAGWKSVSKAEITERLNRGEIKVLLCTDAASEGLNLQSASALINYDLPWNPSKVEQRIGRIDRIGQKQPVLPIRNLFLDDSVDMQVYKVLRMRCGLFEHFVGKMQPVLAMARDALRSNYRREQVPGLIKELETEANKVEGDEVVSSIFVSSSAGSLPAVPAPVTRQDIEKALIRLEQLSGKLKARRDKMPTVWRIAGLERRHIPVTLDRETLERDPDVLPLTLQTEILERLADKLPVTVHSPLIIETIASGPYRCAEVRWVGPDGIVAVESAQHLIDLAEGWDGTPPPPDLRLKAQDQARAAARARVETMQAAAQEQETDNLRQQVEAAQLRLLRELGRTLSCLDSGDLDATLHLQVRRELASERYHQALQLLGGYPQWDAELIEDAMDFARHATTTQRKARVAGSEVDAAIHDPRWMAKKMVWTPRSLPSIELGEPKYQERVVEQNTSKATILLVDPDLDYRRCIRQLLELESYQIGEASSVAEAFARLAVGPFDLVITDLHLIDPENDRDLSGLQFAKAAADHGVPTVIVTSFPTVEAMHTALRAYDSGPLEVGFVPKSNGPQAVLYAIEAVLRRKNMLHPDLPPNLQIDRERGLVYRSGQQVALSRLQYNLLAYLAVQVGAVCSSEELIKEIYDDDIPAEQASADKRLERLVERVREKIEPDARHPRYLVKVHGRGFRLDPQGRG